ncbi:MAG: hypothetical protein K9N07_11435 [Candidatus Cloacimonetes bacterium]|nr:hypothetical protein [Candidatus Cloacimonadota bacterium]
MNNKKINIIIILFLMITINLFGGIIYNGNEYTETMMPYSYKGSTEYRIVISGSINSYSDSRMTTFEINGVDMLSSSALPAPEDGKKYFVHFKGKNKNATISFSGTNDWSEPIDTTSISLPYSESGAGEHYFSTADDLYSVSSSNMDILLINDIDFTNQTSIDLPARINGQYYIYYNASSAFAEADFTLIDTTEINLPFSKTGKGRFYFFTTDELYSVSSTNMDTLLINEADYTNQTSTNISVAPNGNYYIYYVSSSINAELSLELEPNAPIDTINVNLPFTKTGIGQIYFSTTDDLFSVSSSNVDTLLVNDIDYTNQNSSSMPARINGNYYIYYSASSALAELSLKLEPLDTIAITPPFSTSGAKELYYSTTENIASISSSNMDALEINGTDFTNQNSSIIPPKINGYYYIYYKATSAQASMMIGEEAEEPYPDIVNWNGNDYTRVDLPFSVTGGSAQYIYVYGTISDFSSTRVNTLLINGSDYTNQSSTTMPPSIEGKYFIYYDPKNKNSYFEINGLTEELVYILNIKVMLQGALSTY